MKKFIALIASSLICFVAGVHLLFGQSAPNNGAGWSQGFVPTAAQWNAAFAAKQDFTGFMIGRLGFVSRAVNFNAGSTDTSIAIVLPAGFGRYRVTDIMISGASASLSTSTIGVFAATGGNAGFIIAADQAVTVTSPSPDINNNMMSLTLTNGTTRAWDISPIFIRVGTPQGSAATATVAIFVEPVS